MGLLDLFSKKPNPKKINRLAKKMLNEHQQQQIRQEALEELVSLGTPEAIGALIRRLGVNFRDTIKNEQERRWVSDQLVTTFGQDAVTPLIEFIRSEQSISGAIRVLARLISPTKLVDILLEVLAQYQPADHRTIEARMQIIDALDDLEDERVVPAVIPYAMDHDDDIRIKVIGLLETRVDREHAEYATVSVQLFDVLTDPEASGRITRRAARAMDALKVDLSTKAELLEAFMPDGYRFDGTYLTPG